MDLYSGSKVLALGALDLSPSLALLLIRKALEGEGVLKGNNQGWAHTSPYEAHWG